MIRSLAVHDSSTAIAGEVTLGPDVATFAHQSPMLPDDNRHTQNFDSSLTVYNQSAQPQAFFMTQELPQFAPTATVLEKLYSVIYETCRKITNGTGMATFILKANEYSTPDINMAYVITGYSDDPLDLVDGVHSSDAMPIELYQEGHDLAPSCCTMTMSGQAGVAPYFVKGQMGARVAKLLTGNELFISTDSSFGGDDIRHPFLGIGMRNHRHVEQVIPVCFWAASPSSAHRLRISDIWYCFPGVGRPGYVCDVTAEPANATATFSQPGQDLFTTFGIKNTFSPCV